MAPGSIPPTVRLAVLAGRSLAMCAHPYAAWRTRSTSGRLFVVFTYLAASYTVMLAALFIGF